MQFGRFNSNMKIFAKRINNNNSNVSSNKASSWGEPFSDTTTRMHGGVGGAMTIDQYIEEESEKMTPSEFRAMREFFPQLSSKALQAVAEGRYEMVLDIDRLKKIASGTEISPAQRKLHRDLAEVGVALRYLIKGVDLIPDFVEGIGLADDEEVIRRVALRNPKLKLHTSQKSHASGQTGFSGERNS